MPGSFPGPGRRTDGVPSAPPGFELLHPLGEGATGPVWAARASTSGATVALKWVAGTVGGDASSRLRREAEVLAGLDHRNIVRHLDLLELDGGGVVLVTEHAAGGSLADRLAREGKLTADEVVTLGVAIADALAAAHRARVLHRDVKPGNVLFDADGTPMLADFGLAATARRRRGRAGSGRGTAVEGTAEYLDPVVAAGGPPDVRADLYALGITLYEALSGHVPYAAETAEAVVEEAASGVHLPLELVAPDAPEHLRRAIARAMEVDPRLRQPDAATLGAELAGARPGWGGAAGLPWEAPPRRSAAAVAPVTSAEPDPLLPVVGGPVSLPPIAPQRPTRTFGPRPPRPTTPAQVLRRAALLVPIAALVVTAAVLVSPLSPIAGGNADPAGDEAAVELPSTTVPCAGIETGPGRVTADLDGDGCPTSLRWDGAVLEVPPGAGVPVARYAIGRPGDVLLFGDWDCDGVVTPGLHRPDDGEVVVFDRWAEAGSPLEGRTVRGEPGGTASVVLGDDGCDAVAVRR